MSDSARELIFRLDAARAIASFVAPAEPLDEVRPPSAPNDYWPAECFVCGKPTKPATPGYCSERHKIIVEGDPTKPKETTP